MPRRRTKTSWLHRWSRPLIGAIAVLGATNTGYLAATKLAGGEAACPTQGCDLVLSSPYATILGQPLALFGLLAYVAMAIFALVPLAISSDNKEMRTTADNITWFLLFMGATAMMFFSWYLMYIMFSKFVVPYGAGAICIYCIASAAFATLMFLLTILGRSWEDVGQLLFTGIIVSVITLVGTLGIYSQIDRPVTANDATEYQLKSATGQVFFTVTDTSGEAEIELAKHLKQIDAKMFGAFWCPHCADQKKLFGIQAISEMPYVECAPEGPSPQLELCQTELTKASEKLRPIIGRDAGFPTWKIGDQYYSGQQSLQDLAQYSNYQGPKDFKNALQ
ncbi:vitamin K epoxide reductase family protein [Acaryochloris sp. IP29b_bin.137]|uniref:vitamin K epoxide reductase family protein n=1 Tax=Acaryochloris sp. IP29b_bin.137 TaxID=2969217 RepID=UPI0026100CD9|nr:vitamin K epoxide reductase family protein [Acaryochloris sp. IP29b_bin.137]